MKIIQQALQPFFQWLQSAKPGGGLQIFQELEAIFTSHLSGATTAGIQAIELFFKTVGQLDPNSGGFLKDVENFMNKVSTPAGFEKWMADIEADRLLRYLEGVPRRHLQRPGGHFQR